MPKTVDSGSSDRRRQRSEVSRRKIIEAMLKLIRGGNMMPSANLIAETAHISLRTVFRHFEEMDSLYREIAEELEAQIMPAVMAPYEAIDWRGRLYEASSRRARIYEEIMPIRVSANLRRYQSEFLMQLYKRNLLLERTSLSAILPREIAQDRVKFAALEAAMSFQVWRRMRQDQGLSVKVSLASVRLTIDGLVGEA